MAYEKFGHLIKIAGDNAWSKWTNLSADKKLGGIIFVDSTLDTTQGAVKCKIIYAGGVEYKVADATDFDTLYNYVHALAKVASTGLAADVSVSTIEGATYDTTSNDISSTWVSIVESNQFSTSDSIEDIAEKLDNKIAGLADELIADEYVINNIFMTIKNKIGLENNGNLDLSSAQTNELKDDTTVKEAILTLESKICTLNSSLGLSDASLSQLWNDYYYVAPAQLSVSASVSPSSFYKGLKVNPTWTVTVNNYQSYISNATIDGIDITQKLKTNGTYSALETNITNTTSKAINISTSYSDWKGNTPGEYAANIQTTAVGKYYVTSSDSLYTNTTFPVASSNLSGYTVNNSSSTFSIDLGSTEKYIYILTSVNTASNQTKIYVTGTSASGKGGVENLGTISVTEFDNAVEYYLYRSEQKLSGNWTVLL